MSRLTFDAKWDLQPLLGHATYCIEDYAFDFIAADDVQFRQRFGTAGEGILVTDTEQLIVGIETGRLLYVYGYSPYMKWKCCEWSQPLSRPGGVRVHSIRPLISGGGDDLREHLGTSLWFNPVTGWVCLGDPLFAPREGAVEFASATLAAIEDGCLRAVWVRPANWRDVAALYVAGTQAR